MSEKNKKEEKPAGIFETIRQVDENERRKQKDEEEKALKRHDKKREEYAKKLAEDKVELLKLKQGVIDKSDKLELGNDEKKHYNIWQKFKNFIYHNKWWLGIGTFFAFIAAFLIYDKLTSVKSDIMLMMLCDDTELYEKYENMEIYFEGLAEDYNDDGKISADMLYIPISEDEDANNIGLYESNLNRLSAEFQLGETMLVIADKKSDDLVVPEENLIDLEKLYPDDPNVERYAFLLKNTDFAERIGFTGNIPDDLYIGVRKISSTLTPEKDMQENYERALDMLDKLIDDVAK
ncbi:MAG: hypothetical protein NC320_06700 [Clostridium sp.]|nr:hypothetical protein [Clostridium sp.]MCM1547065.1 hypothetical protein [Ruminococcus sp.]